MAVVAPNEVDDAGTADVAWTQIVLYLALQFTMAGVITSVPFLEHDPVFRMRMDQPGTVATAIAANATLPRIRRGSRHERRPQLPPAAAG